MVHVWKTGTPESILARYTVFCIMELSLFACLISLPSIIVDSVIKHDVFIAA